MSSSALAGLTVVAVEQAVAAPLCTARMVDAGARVIKIERDTGDFARGYDDAARGDSSYFAWANHGKESVVLDIKSADDAALLHRIVAMADVFVQNLAPGALARIGFGWEDLRAMHPRLITVDVSGYGESDAVAEKKAYDLLVQAESGLISISGGPNELGRIGVSICDIGTGMAAYSAVLEALISRGVTGQGSSIHVSLFDVAAEWMTVPFVQQVHGDGGPTRVGLRHPTIAPYGAYETDDGALTLISIQNEREWRRLCDTVLRRPGLGTDVRFGSNNDRVANRDELETQLSTVVGEMGRGEFRQRLKDASIAFGAVNTVDDLANHPALRQRIVLSSAGNEVRLPAHPVRSTTGRGGHKPAVPVLGSHTESVRREFRIDS